MSGAGWERTVRDWVERSCATVDGATLDYISVCARVAPKSWPEHASVRVDGRPTLDVLEEVTAHVRDVAESADAEGRGGWAVRLKAYRAKMPAGSKTISSRGDAVSGSDPEADEPVGDAKSETVGVIRELRHLVVHLGGELGANATHGWQLAAKQQEVIVQQYRELADLRARVKYEQAEAPPDPVMQAAASVLPLLPTLLQGLQEAGRARQESRARAEEEGA